MHTFHAAEPGLTPAAYRPADVEQPEAADGRRLHQTRKGEYPPAPEPLAVPVMDNHTHLDFDAGAGVVSVTDACDAAEAAGVGGVVQVGCDLESSRFTRDAVEADRRVLGAVAIHPNEAPEMAAAGTLDAALEEIEALADHERIRAIGETGLDYFRTQAAGIADQQQSFRRHLDIAKRLNLAVQIHDRDAHADVVRILQTDGGPERVVFHCFSGDAELARICNEHGWYMSFSGTVTFKNSAGLREALAVADPSLVMVETDSPFLTPHPYRGRPNASYMIPYTVRSMAQTLGADVDTLSARIAATTETVYGSWG